MSLRGTHIVLTIKEIMAEVNAIDITVSTEGESTVNVEEELVFYGRLIDKDALCKMVDEGMTNGSIGFARKLQEQWEIKSPMQNGRFRCRRESYLEDGATKTEYTLTVKTKRAEGGDTEITQDIDEPLYTAMSEMATAGMSKERFEFPALGGHTYIWEIDVYAGTDWVKIDLELPQPGEDRVRMSANGFAGVLLETGMFSDIFMANESSATKAKCQELYSNHFLIIKEPPTKES
jgi:hypothetical protein